jgi:hypothetical protein
LFKGSFLIFTKAAASLRMSSIRRASLLASSNLKDLSERGDGAGLQAAAGERSDWLQEIFLQPAF